MTTPGSATPPQTNTAAIPTSPPAPPPAEQIRAQLTAAAAETPADPQGCLELALFDLRLNNATGAEQELKQCITRFPQFGRAFFHLGMLYLRQRRDVEAVGPLDRASRLISDEPQPRVYSALAYYHLGQPEEAKKRLAEAIKIAPLASEPYMLMARIYDAHGTAQIALKYLLQYVERSPNPAAGYYMMGRINAQLAYFPEAEKWTRKAVEADPKNPTFLVTLGRIYFELGGKERAANAVTCYEQAVAAAPDYGDAHRYLGHALLTMQRYGEAIMHLQAALATSDDQGPIYYDLGQALLKANRAAEGQAALAKYREASAFSKGYDKLVQRTVIAPRDPAGHIALARFCLERRQYRSAAQVALDGIRRSRPNEELKQIAAEALSRRGSGGGMATAPVLGNRTAGGAGGMLDGD